MCCQIEVLSICDFHMKTIFLPKHPLHSRTQNSQHLTNMPTRKVFCVKFGMTLFQISCNSSRSYSIKHVHFNIFFMLQYLIITYLILLSLQTREKGLHIDSSTVCFLQGKSKRTMINVHMNIFRHRTVCGSGLNESSIWFCSASSKANSLL